MNYCLQHASHLKFSLKIGVSTVTGVDQ